MMNLSTLKQRSDYTHKFNANEGRHGWLRLTPAYSVKIVSEILEASESTDKVLDPFSGTATTALCAAFLGIDSSTVEINPFLVWLGKTKVDQYSGTVFSNLQNSSVELLKSIDGLNDLFTDIPPIHNISRWWDPIPLKFLCKLRKIIEDNYPDDCSEKSLLLIAFCRTLIKISNVAFNHQSMSFKDSFSDDLFSDNIDAYKSIFLKDVEYVISSSRENPIVKANVIYGDSRFLSDFLDEKYNLVITSPPYPNRMSYIRELRPYMYWLGYLINPNEAGEIDWQAIGGTWGIATSRLQGWEPDKNTFYPKYIFDILKSVSHNDNKNGKLLANYIMKYFEDIWLHLKSLRNVLTLNAKLHYIIGNSTFYGALLPTEKIYADMLNELGFKNIHIKAIRKRNSKKELVEYDVSASF